MRATICIVDRAGTTLGSNRDINQVDATAGVGVGAGVGTALGVNHASNQVDENVGTGTDVGITLGTNHEVNQVGTVLLWVQL